MRLATGACSGRKRTSGWRATWTPSLKISTSAGIASASVQRSRTPPVPTCSKLMSFHTPPPSEFNKSMKNLIESRFYVAHRSRGAPSLLRAACEEAGDGAAEVNCETDHRLRLAADPVRHL